MRYRSGPPLLGYDLFRGVVLCFGRGPGRIVETSKYGPEASRECVFLASSFANVSQTLRGAKHLWSKQVVGRILPNLSALHGYIYLSHDTVLPSLLPPCHLSSAQAPSGSQGLLARGTTVDSSIARKVNHQSTVMSWQGESFKWNS